MISHDQLWKLFDIVPNMDYCKMNQESGKYLFFINVFYNFFLIKYFLDVSSSATVVYKTHQAAMHARQKLHGFEYPIGESK